MLRSGPACWAGSRLPPRPSCMATGVAPGRSPADRARPNSTRGTQLFDDAKYREAVQALVRAREYDPELKAPATRLGGAVAAAGRRLRPRRAGGQLAGHLDGRRRGPRAARRDALEHRALRGSQRPLHHRADARRAAIRRRCTASPACSTPAARRPTRSSPSSAPSSAIRKSPSTTTPAPTCSNASATTGVAADELERYLRYLPEKGFKDQIKLAKARMKFLRHFGDRTPLSMGADVPHAGARHPVPRGTREAVRQGQDQRPPQRRSRARHRRRDDRALRGGRAARAGLLGGRDAQRRRRRRRPAPAQAGAHQQARDRHAEDRARAGDDQGSAAEEVAGGRHRRVLAARGRAVDARRLRRRSS